MNKPRPNVVGIDDYIVCTRYDYPYLPDEMEPRIRLMLERIGIPYLRIEQREYNAVVKRKIWFSEKDKDTKHYIMVVVVAPDTSNKHRAQLNGACFGFSFGLNPRWRK